MIPRTPRAPQSSIMRTTTRAGTTKTTRSTPRGSSAIDDRHGTAPHGVVLRVDRDTASPSKPRWRSERSISGAHESRRLRRADDRDRPRREQRAAGSSPASRLRHRGTSRRATRSRPSAPARCVIRRNSSRAGRFAVSIITSSSVFAAIAARNPATSHARLSARFVVWTTNGSFFAISSASASVASSSSVARHDPVHQPDPQRLVGRDPVLAGEQQLLGGAHADHPRQEHRDDARSRTGCRRSRSTRRRRRPRGRRRASGRCRRPGSRTGPRRSPAWGSRGSRASSRCRAARLVGASARASSSPSSASSFRS